MPVYEYRCGRCEHGFEVLEPMPGTETKDCPHCDGRATRRISVVNHTFGFRLTERAHIVGNPKEEMERAV